MTAVIQRVLRCSVVADGEPRSKTENGMLILLGVRDADTDKDAEVLASKIDGLRIFTDENGKMNLSVNDVGGKITVVSNFTLCAEGIHVRKGKRPSFTPAAAPEEADRLYEKFVGILRRSSAVETGVFGADMQIELVNDGPITLVVNSEDLIKK